MKANKSLTLAIVALIATSACASDKIEMREAYSSKTPVLFVHGLWDSKATWGKMIRELESDPVIAKRYQIWSFSYDTYQPFWAGAASLRNELDRIHKEHPKHKKIILVGHSMGGLISHQVVTDYGAVHRTDIARAIFICAPHRGSDWGVLALTPAVDALSTSNAAYQTLNRLPVCVPFHSIIGRFDELVDYSSSHLDGAASEKIVDTMHGAHWTDQGVREVGRILNEN